VEGGIDEAEFDNVDADLRVDHRSKAIENRFVVYERQDHYRPTVPFVNGAKLGTGAASLFVPAQTADRLAR
jgi:hypothetical protein